MAKVGRPKKTTRNPFIFHDKFRTKRLPVISRIMQHSKSSGGSFFESTLIDSEKNPLHISQHLLNHYCRKGSDTTEAAILFYILSKLYRGKEQINLDPKLVSIETGFSAQKLSRVFGQLAKAEIIKREKSRSNNYYYWINIEMIFQGDRISHIKKKCKDDAEFNSIVQISKTKKVKDLEDD